MHKKGKDGARVIRFVMEIAYVTQPDNERNSSDYILMFYCTSPSTRS